MSDNLFQNLSTVQSNEQPTPPTIASAAAISPVNFVTFLTGTVQVTSIVPPATGMHMLVLIFTNGSPGGLGAGTGVNNIKAAITIAQNVPVLCIFDPVTSLWWCGVLKTS